MPLHLPLLLLACVASAALDMRDSTVATREEEQRREAEVQRQQVAAEQQGQQAEAKVQRQQADAERLDQAPCMLEGEGSRGQDGERLQTCISDDACVFLAFRVCRCHVLPCVVVCVRSCDYDALHGGIRQSDWEPCAGGFCTLHRHPV